MTYKWTLPDGTVLDIPDGWDVVAREHASKYHNGRYAGYVKHVTTNGLYVLSKDGVAGTNKKAEYVFLRFGPRSLQPMDVQQGAVIKSKVHNVKAEAVVKTRKLSGWGVLDNGKIVDPFLHLRYELVVPACEADQVATPPLDPRWCDIGDKLRFSGGSVFDLVSKPSTDEPGMVTHRAMVKNTVNKPVIIPWDDVIAINGKGITSWIDDLINGKHVTINAPAVTVSVDQTPIKVSDDVIAHDQRWLASQREHMESIKADLLRPYARRR